MCHRGSRSDIILSIGIRLDIFVREVPVLPLQIHDCPSTAEGHRKHRFFTPGSMDQSPNTLRRLSNVARNNTWHASRTPNTIRQASYLLVTFIKETWLKNTTTKSRHSAGDDSAPCFLLLFMTYVRKYSIFITEKQPKQTDGGIYDWKQNT